jgi:hypothetical protein
VHPRSVVGVHGAVAYCVLVAHVAQAAQTRLLVAVHTAVRKDSAAQSPPQATQARLVVGVHGVAWYCAAEQTGAQAEHTRSVESVHAAERNVSGSAHAPEQGTQTVLLTLLHADFRNVFPSEQVPQSTQMLRSIGPHGVEAYVPNGHG